MDNKHGKLFAIKQSKGCKFMSKMHQNAFGGRALPVPAGELMSSIAAMGSLLLTSKGREGRGKRKGMGNLLIRGEREGELGLLLRGTEGRVRRRQGGTERDRKGILTQFS